MALPSYAHSLLLLFWDFRSSLPSDRVALTTALMLAELEENGVYAHSHMHAEVDLSYSKILLSLSHDTFHTYKRSIVKDFH